MYKKNTHTCTLYTQRERERDSEHVEEDTDFQPGLRFSPKSLRDGI